MEQLKTKGLRCISRFFLKITTLVLYIITISAFVQAQSLIPELSFKNPVLRAGRGCMGDGQDGAVYVFENVGCGIDAVMTILGRSNSSVTLVSADINGPEQNDSGTGYDNAWQPEVRFANGTALPQQSWWMEFKIDFVKHGEQRIPVSVNQFFVTGFDIDGDGKQLHEFQVFYRMHSFSLERQTAIFTTSVRRSEANSMLKGKRFDGPVKNYRGISLTAKDAMVNNFYQGTNSMIVRLGAVTGKIRSVDADRKYGLLFKSLAFDIPVIKKIPANLIALNGSWTNR